MVGKSLFGVSGVHNAVTQTLFCTLARLLSINTLLLRRGKSVFINTFRVSSNLANLSLFNHVGS
jgi:hypothetical protein